MGYYPPCPRWSLQSPHLGKNNPPSTRSAHMNWLSLLWLQAKSGKLCGAAASSFFSQRHSLRPPHGPMMCRNDGDALSVSQLRMYQDIRQRYTLKASQELVYVPIGALFTGVYSPGGRTVPSSALSLFLPRKACYLSEQVVCAFVLFSLLWHSLGPQRCVGHQRSITKIVLEDKILVEAAPEGT